MGCVLSFFLSSPTVYLLTSHNTHTLTLQVTKSLGEYLAPLLGRIGSSSSDDATMTMARSVAGQVQQRYASVPRRPCAVVAGVLPGSPAEQAGIR